MTNRDDLGTVHGAIPGLVKKLSEGKLPRREFLRSATLLGLSASAAYAVAGRITGEHFIQPARAQGAMGGTLRISMNVMEIVEPAAFDWSQKGNLARAVIEPLTKVGADNITRPYLAERWEANDDLTEWTFYLRRNVTWNNGDSFIADDVVANMERWLDEATGFSNFARFSSIETVEKVDDHTVKFHLRTPDLSIPESLADYTCLIVHRRFWEEGGNFQENPIGTGPFLLTDFAVGQRASYAKRMDAPWWGGEVALDGIEVIDHGDDPSAFLAALASGQVDLLYEMSTDQVPAVRGMQNLVLYEAITGQTGVARMKVDEPPFDDLRVRQAVRACIDHSVLLELAYQNLGTPGEDHHVCPIHPEYAEIERPMQDYERARALLTEAGYPDGIDLTIDCVAQPSWEPTTCQVMAEMLRPAGIRLAVNIMPGGTYWDRWLVAPFGFTSWTHRPLGVQVLNIAYRTGGAWNETAYSNPEYDALLDEANGLLDPDERREVVRRLEAILQEDSVIVQPFWRAIQTASSDRLEGFELQPAREFDYPALSLAGG